MTGKRRKSQGSKKNQPTNWKINESKEAKIFDPSAASLRKNKEYLELKRNIALKGLTFKYYINE